MIIWGVLVVIGFSVGYMLGRREGIRIGVDQGRALRPLDLKEQAFREGKCPICSGTLAANEGENCQGDCAMVE